MRRPAAALLPATALLWACSDLAVRTAIRDEFESHGSTAHLAEEMARRPDLASCKILFLGRLPYSAWFYLTQPTHEVREKKSVLDHHLAQNGCHVLVFEEDELRHVDTTQWPERLCEHGKYRVFIDRGETAARAAEPAPLGTSATASR